MLKRLLERAKTSGREDDNEESIRKRFRTSCSRGLFREALTNYSAGVYKEQTMPVIEHYSKEGKVATVRQVPQMFPSTHAHVVPRSTRRPRSRMCTQRLRRLWPRSWLVRSAATSPHETATREDDLDTRRTIYRNNAALVFYICNIHFGANPHDRTSTGISSTVCIPRSLRSVVTFLKHIMRSRSGRSWVSPLCTAPCRRQEW